MKKLAFILLLLSVVSCDSTKGHDYEGKNLPEPRVEVTGPNYGKTGVAVTFTADAPPNYRERYVWEMNWGYQSNTFRKETATNTVSYVYEQPGIYHINVSCFSETIAMSGMHTIIIHQR